MSDQDELPELVPQRVANDVVDVDQNPVVAETESQHNEEVEVSTTSAAAADTNEANNNVSKDGPTWKG